MFKIIEFDELISTNKFALEKIANYPSGTVIRANKQTAGRGRFDRKWVSDNADNCYLSFILKPDKKYQKVFPNITQYLSIVVCQELLRYGIKASIKWPNDILVDGKKIAGILSETSFSGEKFNGIVVGLGINLNLTQKDLSKIDIPATSIKLETGKDVDSKKFIEYLAKRFFGEYETLLRKGFKYFRAQYISYTDFIGKNVTIKNPEITDLGIAINVCEDGALEILTEEGEIKKVISGDVIL